MIQLNAGTQWGLHGYERMNLLFEIVDNWCPQLCCYLYAYIDLLSEQIYHVNYNPAANCRLRCILHRPQPQSLRFLSRANPILKKLGLVIPGIGQVPGYCCFDTTC